LKGRCIETERAGGVSVRFPYKKIRRAAYAAEKRERGSHMAIRKIITVEEEELLRRRSKTVDVFDERLRVLIEDMKETMKKADGAGLAAPQIGILKKVAVCVIDGKETVFINPEIVSEAGGVVDTEGCLSIPGKRGKVKRPAEITVRAQRGDGVWFSLKAEGDNARVVCHETDHLNGILYTDKAESMEKI
jgi:peptide deformylase